MMIQKIIKALGI